MGDERRDGGGDEQEDVVVEDRLNMESGSVVLSWECVVCAESDGRRESATTQGRLPIILGRRTWTRRTGREGHREPPPTTSTQRE